MAFRKNAFRGINYFRHMSHAPSLREWFAFKADMRVEDSPPIRPKRGHRNIPEPYDDIQVSDRKRKSWKHTQHKQYKQSVHGKRCGRCSGMFKARLRTIIYGKKIYKVCKSCHNRIR